MSSRWLAALPVYNERSSVGGVLDEVREYARDVLVVDDGSTDGTSELLQARSDIVTIRHEKNQGYGAGLKTAFRYAVEEGFDVLVTLDCDGQHQPKRIPRFVAATRNADIVSGSRYLKQYPGDDAPPPQRLFINRTITRQLNHKLGLQLTDGFCGFKAYRTSCLGELEPRITDLGYAMPLQVWVEAALMGLRIIEIPVPLIYLDLARSFGGELDHAETRLKHYNQVLDSALERACAEGRCLPHARRPCQDFTG